MAYFVTAKEEVSRIDATRPWTCAVSRVIGNNPRYGTRPRLGMPFVNAIVELHRERTRDTRQKILRKLKRRVAKLAEKYMASSAWLFMLEADNTLRAVVTHNSSQHDLRMPLAGMPGTHKGIVPFVARSKKGLCLSDVKEGPYSDVYENKIPETRSELTVPILLYGTDLLAVLNLESTKHNKFAKGSVDELEADGLDLVVDLLCLRAIDTADVSQWPWHPDICGWSVTDALEEICDAVVESTTHDRLDNVSCTIWHYDRAKAALFVRATSGYDQDFVADKMLPHTSFTGRVARLSRDAVRYGSPNDADFVEWEKAENMGVTYIAAAPIYAARTSAGRGDDTAEGTLNVYLLGHMHASLIPPRREVRQVSDMIGAMMHRHRHLRHEVACALLHSQLQRAKQVSYVPEMLLNNQLATIKEVVPVCLSASGCSVFIIYGDDLRCVETTGIGPIRFRSTDDIVVVQPRHPESVTYSLNDPDDWGIMTFLAKSPPGTVVRKHRANDVDEQGVPAGYPRQVVTRKNLEHLVSPEPTDRRFLGIALGVEGRTIGVLRLVRPLSASPFVAEDDELLKQLVEIASDVLRDLREVADKRAVATK